MQRKLWICPECGRSLTVPKQEHVCGLYGLEPHFDRKDPIGQTTFTWMCGVLESMGPCDVLPMKTMIAFARGVNVAFLRTKRQGAEVSVVLSRPLAEARIFQSVPYSRAKAIHRTLILAESDLDTELESWLREAYSGGRDDF